MKLFNTIDSAKEVFSSFGEIVDVIPDNWTWKDALLYYYHHVDEVQDLIGDNIDGDSWEIINCISEIVDPKWVRDVSIKAMPAPGSPLEGFLDPKVAYKNAKYGLWEHDIAESAIQVHRSLDYALEMYREGMSDVNFYIKMINMELEDKNTKFDLCFHALNMINNESGYKQTAKTEEYVVDFVKKVIDKLGDSDSAFYLYDSIKNSYPNKIRRIWVENMAIKNKDVNTATLLYKLHGSSKIFVRKVVVLANDVESARDIVKDDIANEGWFKSQFPSEKLRV